MSLSTVYDWSSDVETEEALQGIEEEERILDILLFFVVLERYAEKFKLTDKEAGEHYKKYGFKYLLEKLGVEEVRRIAKEQNIEVDKK
jgi:hypothetical protein